METSFTTSWNTFELLAPEIALVAMAAWIFLSGTWETFRRAAIPFAGLGLLAAGVGLWLQADLATALANADGPAILAGPVGFDLFGYSVRWLTLGVGALLVAQSMRSESGTAEPETMGALLIVIAGLMLVAVSRELILIFLGLEMISIPTYLLLVLGRRGQLGQEATVKYFFLSILASAMLLYGFSFLYGITGSTWLVSIQNHLAAPTESLAPLGALMPVALLLIFAGLGFKIAAVPFHFYAPDVYQGTSNANAALLAVVPKIAGIVALVRIGGAVMPGLADYAWQICLILAIATMTVGNVMALWQTNLRRLMAYSSIAHAGYMLIGLAVWLAASQSGEMQQADAGLTATLLYLAMYVVASLGTFAAWGYLGSEGRQTETLDDLAGLSDRHRGAALALALFMFSLAGIPPLAGFWGKLSLLTSALSIEVARPALFQVSMGRWFTILAIAGALNAAIAAAYYLRVVATMYFQQSTVARRAEGGSGAAWSMSVCAVVVLGLGIYPGVAFQAAKGALPVVVLPVRDSITAHSTLQNSDGAVTQR